MSRCYALLIPFFLTVVLGASPAYSKEILLNTVIVSARGVGSSQSKTPGGTGVVDAADITLAPKASLADSMQRISGVTRTGDSPWGQDISIRGLSSESVVVLVDGMRVNTATEINARMGFINALDVDRIEVLKGPISSLYGSGSTGGVVNIITKKGAFTAEPSLGGEMILGWSTNPEGGDGYARAHYSDQDLWLQLSGGLRDHEDVHGGDDTRIANSQYDDQSYRLAGSARLSERLRIDFQAMNMEANDVGIPGGSSTMPQTAPVTYPGTLSTMAGADFVWTPDAAILDEILLNVFYTKNKRRVVIDQPVPVMASINPSAEHETMGGKLQGRFGLGAHQLVAGIDAWNWHMVSMRERHLVSGAVVLDHPTPNTTQLSTGVFAEDDWKLADRWTLNLGARLDRIEVKNKEHANYEASEHENMGWNAHAGLTWTPAEHWSHTLIAASSYRAPDIMERFKRITLGGGVTVQGNPDLDPEKSWFLEYGLHYSADTLKASASAYANFLTDYIAQSVQDASTVLMENIGEARILGLELDAEWRFHPAWSLYGNIAFADGQDEENDEPLPAVAPLSGLAGIKYTLDNGLWVRLETDWAAGQSDVPDGVATTDAWMTLDAAAGYGFEWAGTHHELSLGVNNILDKDYVNYLANARAIELLEPGISASLVYRVSF